MAMKVIQQANSNHNAIILDTMGRKPKEEWRDPRLMFRYDECRGMDTDAKKVTKKAWSSSKVDVIKSMEATFFAWAMVTP